MCAKRFCRKQLAAAHLISPHGRWSVQSADFSAVCVSFALRDSLVPRAFSLGLGKRPWERGCLLDRQFQTNQKTTSMCIRVTYRNSIFLLALTEWGFPVILRTLQAFFRSFTNSKILNRKELRLVSSSLITWTNFQKMESFSDKFGKSIQSKPKNGRNGAKVGF